MDHAEPVKQLPVNCRIALHVLSRELSLDLHDVDPLGIGRALEVLVQPRIEILVYWGLRCVLRLLPLSLFSKKFF